MNHFNQKRFGKVCRICATESTSLKKMSNKETQYFELDVERFNQKNRICEKCQSTMRKVLITFINS